MNEIISKKSAIAIGFILFLISLITLGVGASAPKISNWYHNNGREYIIENPNHKNMQPWGDIESKPEELYTPPLPKANPHIPYVNVPQPVKKPTNEIFAVFKKLETTAKETAVYIIKHNLENVNKEYYKPETDIGNGADIIGYGTALPLAFTDKDGTKYYAMQDKDNRVHYVIKQRLVIYREQAEDLLVYELMKRAILLYDTFGNTFVNLPNSQRIAILDIAFNEGFSAFVKSKTRKLMFRKANNTEICKELLNIEKPTKGFQRRKGMQCRLIKNQL